MKKLLLLTIAFISAVTISTAQDFKLGVKGGLNIANINVKDSNIKSNLDSKTGYHIGFVGQFSLLDKIALQPEILYSAQGAKDVDIDYLNVPILVKYKFLQFLSFDAGPQFGFKVKDDITNLEKPKSFDLSACVGAGVEFQSFFGQIRYNFGLTDVIDNVKSKNGVFQVSVGYYIF